MSKTGAEQPLADERPSGQAGEPRRAIRWIEVLVAVAVAIFIVGVLVGLMIVGRRGGGPIQGWDDTVGHWYLRHRGSLVGISKFIATTLDALPLGIICVVLTLVLAATLRTTRALLPIVAYLGGEFEVFAIRSVIQRHRPPTANWPSPGAVNGIHETSYSFPSGHSVAVTAVLFALLGCIALTQKSWWPWVVAAIGSLFVADTRLVLGVHWFSDVAFGVLFGVAWGVSVALAIHNVEWADLIALVRRGPRSAASRS